MIYKFVILSDEVDDFMREIQVDSESTFLELQNAILDSVGYTADQMTSFFICNDDWEKGQEITLVEMDTSSEYDSYVMEDTKIEELASDEGQKLLFVYDYLNERAFFMELKEIISGKALIAPVCTRKSGAAPAQMLDDMFAADLLMADAKGDLSFDDDYAGIDSYNEDELDDLNIDDNYFDEKDY